MRKTKQDLEAEIRMLRNDLQVKSDKIKVLQTDIELRNNNEKNTVKVDQWYFNELNDKANRVDSEINKANEIQIKLNQSMEVILEQSKTINKLINK